MEAFPKIPEPVILEHQLAEVMQDQKRTGWPFDIQKAQELENKLLNRLEELRVATETVCTFVPGNIFIPKRDNKKQGYIKDAPMQRLKDFNPSSREHIAWWFKTFQGWEPNKLTPTGKAVIDETVLKEIGSKEALIFLEILVTQKKLGMLSQGQNAWLKLVKNGRLHHSCFIGAATHRMAHSHPNLAQVSSDKDCRELFITKPGWKLVDSDLAGIELRMFAHYLHRYDGGRYADVLLNGDIHQENADKIGISRRLVKTVTYAFLYGAGNIKIGLSYDPMLSKDKASKKGAGSIRAIDGRILSVDKPHKALNFLLQGSAGVLAKRWILITNNTLTKYGIEHARYAFVHDEQVLGAPPSSADQVAGVCKLSAMEAGEYYNLRLVIEADANIGNNWSEVH